MLKNKLFALAFVLALVGGATVASAYSFPSTIDTKQEKMDVQTVLNMTTGSTLTVDGVLGAKSIAAVKAFQTMKGLVADGKIGPMTRAALEAASVGGSTVSTVAGCAAGAAFSATTGAACGTTVVVTPGTTMTGSTDGSITAGTSSYVSSGITVKKGETKDIAAVRLQATSGPVKVSYVDVQFNVRPWLFFSQVALHDSTGKVIATKTLSSIADTTEITVGSLYQVRFEGLNYVVTPGTNPDIALSATVLPATDKIPVGGQTVVSGFTSMRTISEVGYSNTVSYAAFATNGTSTNTNSVSLTSTGSAALIYSRISPSSPLAGQQVVNATSGQTTYDVVLGAFSLKSTSNSSTLNTLKVNILGTATSTTDFSNFRLYVNGAAVAGGTLSSGVITFSNLTQPLALDTWTDITIKADVAGASTGTVWLTVNNTVTDVVVTDANYSTLTTGLNYDGSTRISNILTLTANSVSLSNAVATLGSAIVQANVTTGYNATYAFTLTNNSNNDMYVSSTAATFVSSTTTGGATSATSALTSVTVNPSTVSGDDSVSNAYYAIPTGTSRTFTFAAVLRGTTGGTTLFKAIAINYGVTTSGTGSTITTGLSGLSLTSSF